MIKKKFAPLIFVWVGSCLPKWAISSINFASSNNIDRKIILLLDKNSNILFKNKNHSFDLVFLPNQFMNECKFKDQVNLSNPFWINTAKRLKVLYQYCKTYKIEKFFHAEVDNLIFPLAGLENNLNDKGFGFFAPKDNNERALASLIFCNKIDSIKDIFQYFYPPYLAASEMHALGLYSKNSKDFFALPTESFLEVKNKWDILSPKNSDGIFDAAAIGQYILGVDPIHEPYKPLFNMFVNENVLVEFKDLYFYSKNRNLFVFFSKISESYKIYNLHVHSKKINLAISMLNEKNKILKRLSLGKKTLIANKHKFVTGKLKYILLAVKRKIIKKFKN
ncbi:MAG: hypothetical protein JJ845_001765 [Prochlorococcus marinus CUG1436]|nr:hypothetical protein [Prochlorococcus marinus CUG1436]